VIDVITQKSRLSYELVDFRHMRLEQVNVVDGNYLTFGEMTLLTCRLSIGLIAAGFKPRDRLLMICHDVIEYAAVFFAVARCRGHFAALRPAASDGMPANPYTVSGKSLRINSVKLLGGMTSLATGL